MSCTRTQFVAKLQEWVGKNEADGSHEEIVDIYNSHKPLARGVKMEYDWPWCACTISAAAIECDATDIIPTEVSCSKMIELFKAMGCWVEADDHIPQPGDIIFYDWDDSGKGDNKGAPEHVGGVEKVAGEDQTIIEGNYNNAVKRRPLEVNGRYIRGYGVPKYDAEPSAKTDFTVGMRNLKKGCKGEDVRALQILLIGNGFSCGKYGADGDFGSDTEKAVKAYQKAKGLTADGIAGTKTWNKLLKG